jgi:hypothetical protein
MARLRIATTLAVLVALAVALVPGFAQGERAQSGNLVVALNGGVSPLALPRQRPAPVAVHLSGRIGTADGSPLPQVKRVEIELAGPGLLYNRGLAVCPRARLANANPQQAINRCGSALVGRGSLEAQVAILHQAPFAIDTHLLAFNGRTAAGRSAIWVHAFSANPPISLVLPFVVHPGRRSYPTVLVATLPRSLGPLPRLAAFDLNLFRRYSYRGRLHSYISASCPVPPSFTAGFLSFARVVYGFAGNRQVRIESVRSCRASG